MANSLRESRHQRLVFGLALLLILLAAGAVGYLFGPAAAKAPRNIAQEEPDPVPALPARKAAPIPDPEPGPKPAPVVEVPPPRPPREVTLPPLTRFRRLVLEADTVLELADPARRPDADRIEELDATLRALNSRFAVYSAGMVDGTATPGEWSQLQEESSALFLRPDVGKGAYVVERAPRVAIWLRQGARLPQGESAAPPGVSIPLGRRLQEGVSAEIATRWLEAMEFEYGKTNFGMAPDNLPFDMVIFGSSAEYQDFSRRRLRLNVPSWSAGFYSTAWDVACAPVLENTSLAEVLRHEMFHGLQAHLAPHSLLVPWFAEGSAEWLDKAPPQGNQLRTHRDFAGAAYGYLATLIDQGYELNLREFLALDMPAFYARPELHYLTAYCFVDFLRNEEDLREVYFQFWKLMVGGASADAAFDRSFGLHDLDEIQRRFLAKLRAAPRTTRAPRFTHDGAPEFFDRMPARLSGDTAPVQPGKVSDAWYEVLGKLEAAGFSVAANGYLRGNYDRIVIAIDHTQSMDQRLDSAVFDFDALGRWLFSMRYAGTLSLKRTTLGADNEEEVPPAVLMTLVDAVLTGRSEAFVAASGIKVGPEVEKDIRTNWDRSDLQGRFIDRYPKRELARITAESIAWYWGTRQEQANVTVVDFNTAAHTGTISAPFSVKGQVSVRTPIQTLFRDLERKHRTPNGLAGADTDWWQALQQALEAAGAGGSNRVACMFFTDGPNSAGFYGHLETGRNDELYMRDQKTMARSFAEAWINAGLGEQGTTSVMQLVALPGAEAQGLEEITAACPQAKLDAWWPRFKKP